MYVQMTECTSYIGTFFKGNSYVGKSLKDFWVVSIFLLASIMFWGVWIIFFSPG